MIFLLIVGLLFIAGGIFLIGYAQESADIMRAIQMKDTIMDNPEKMMDGYKLSKKIKKHGKH